MEPVLAKGISDMQRGFLPNRSMLQNVLEVDAEMRLASLGRGAAAAIFFDFASAFPSLAHEFLRAVLLRAYADDLAVVCGDLQAALRAIGRIITEYARVSSLALNLRKMVLTPLGAQSPEELSRLLLERNCPGWSAAPIRLRADHLGFVLGPEAGDKCWRREQSL